VWSVGPWLGGWQGKPKGPSRNTDGQRSDWHWGLAHDRDAAEASEQRAYPELVAVMRRPGVLAYLSPALSLPLARAGEGE